MVWFRVDDSLPTHHRVIAAGNAAIGLWVRCGAWSMGQLTDGFIPDAVARMFGTDDEVTALLETGLWTRVTGGYQFHRWAEDGSGAPRQPTRDEIEAKRKADRERKRTALEARRGADGRAKPSGVPADVPQGLREDSARNPDGIHAESQRPSDHPDPTRPDPSPLTSFEGGASASPPVDNSGDDPEPPIRCPAHLGLAQPPKCGACKDARIEHERWEIRTLAAEKAAAAQPRYDPAVYCEHLQRRGACEICEVEARRAGTVIAGPWDAA